MKSTPLCLGLGLLLATPLAVAQENAWTFEPYLWATGIQGDLTLGTLSRDFDVDFGELLDITEGSLSLHVEKRNGGHGFLGDLVHAALEPADQSEVDFSVIELGYFNTRDRQRASSGFEAGIRHWNLEMRVGPVARDQSLTNVFGGYRSSRAIANDWTWTSRINVGTGDAELDFGLETDFVLELGKGALTLGVKVLSIKTKRELVDGAAFENDATYAGMTVGYLF